jgi:hypothetical protein
MSSSAIGGKATPQQGQGVKATGGAGGHRRNSSEYSGDWAQ